MTTLVSPAGFQALQPASFVVRLVERVTVALRRAADARYVEQRARLARTGAAGLI